MKTPKITSITIVAIFTALALYSPICWAEEFTISLKQGENLISIPLVPPNPSIPAVLSSIAGNYTDVWTHNAGDAIDPWKHYNPDYTGYNDLKTIEHGKGYRLFTNKDCVLKVTGTTPSTQTYPLTLHQGWNLIGWPFVYSQTIPEALKGLQFGIDYDQVSRINPLTKEQEDYYNDSITNDFNTFEPGRAYYIYCLKDVTVTLTSPTGRYPIYSNRSATTAYWVDASSYRSFTEAIAAIGPQEKTLLIPNEQKISSNITIPSNIELHFSKGGKLTIPANVTLTINGTVDAGLFQIFKYTETGTGKVTFGQGAVKELYPQWWGAKGDGTDDDTAAIQAVLDATAAGGAVILPPGTYKITSTLNISNRTCIRGVGWASQIEAHSCDAFNVSEAAVLASTEWANFVIAGVNCQGKKAIKCMGAPPAQDYTAGVVFSNLYIRDFGYGMYFRGITCCVIRDCQINRTWVGIKIKGQCVNTTIDRCHISFDFFGEGTIGNRDVLDEDKLLSCGISVNGSSDYDPDGNTYHGPEALDISNTVIIGMDIGIDSSRVFCETIIACDIDNITKYGIVMGEQHGGRTIRDCWICLKGANALYGIYTPPWETEEVDPFIISHNVISAIQSPHEQSIGVYIRAKHSNVTVCDNSFTGFQAYDILFETTKKGLIKNNDCLSTHPTYSIETRASTGKHIIRENNTAGLYSIDSGASPIITFGAGDPAPSVKDETMFLAGTGGAITITNFTNGIPGQIITIIAKNPVTITNNTNILLNKGISFDMAINDILTLIQESDGKWYEISRSVNHK